jgi:hypothetical protein
MPSPKSAISEILRSIGEASVRNKTDKMSMAEIDELIQEVRRDRRKRDGAA